MMKKTLAFTASVALLFSACDQPTAPDGSSSRRHRPNAAYVAAAGDAIAFRSCYSEVDPEYGYTGNMTCELNIMNADGSVSFIGYVGTGGQDSEVYQSRHSWSPDGTRIAYAAWGEIYVVTAADGGSANLTNAFSNDRSPAWSPDGARIAFASDRDGPLELYVMNAADGSNVMRITNGVGVSGSGNPTWSPDGSRIAFDCVVEAGNDDICAINADGTGLVRLTSDPAFELEADFSPNGARIAFTQSGQIAVMDADGGNVTVLSSWGAQPDWSPAGDKIVFVRVYYGGACNADGSYCGPWGYYYVMNADGTNESGGAYGSGPAWRPGTSPSDMPPVARFSSSCIDLTCSFDGSASTDDHGVTSFLWTLGDGNDGYGASPVHTYAAAGTYQVTLVVSDAWGQTGSATASVTVTEPPDAPPVARFTANCSGLACSFHSGASSDDWGIVSRAWTFGDGTSAGDVVAPNHSYGAGGTYAVTLTVTDMKGQTNSVSQSVTAVDQPPVARFTARCSGLACSFESATSTDDVGIVSRAWTFGDGAAAGDVVAPSHTYGAGGGTYTVTLTVTDTKGQTNSVSQSVTAVDQPPVASFSFTCGAASRGQTTCTFDGRSSSDDVGVSSYAWTLGSRGAASGAVVTASFKSRSTQVITLTVKDVAGQASSVTQTITAR